MKLYHNTKAQEKLLEYLKTAEKILINTKIELKEQGVTDNFTLQDLKDGKFVNRFTTYHKSAQEKQLPGAIHNEYLKLYGKSANKLEVLEDEYLALLNKEFKYYKTNDAFYSYCYARKYELKCAEILNNAPKISTYSLFDFVAIKGNSITYNVPNELFELHTTNKKQLQFLKNLKQYIELSRSLYVDRKEVMQSIGKYINSLSLDMTKFEYNNYEILKIQ